MTHRLLATNQILQKPAVCTLQTRQGNGRILTTHEYAVSNMEQVSAAIVDSINTMKVHSHNPRALIPGASAA